MGGKAYGAAELDRLASLPTRDQALSMFLACLVQPATMLVRVMAEPANQLARVIKAVGDTKQAPAAQESEAQAPEAQASEAAAETV